MDEKDGSCDCNDGDAAIHPGASEISDQIDNDCDEFLEHSALLEDVIRDGVVLDEQAFLIGDSFLLSTNTQGIETWRVDLSEFGVPSDIAAASSTQTLSVPCSTRLQSGLWYTTLLSYHADGLLDWSVNVQDLTNLIPGPYLNEVSSSANGDIHFGGSSQGDSFYLATVLTTTESGQLRSVVALGEPNSYNAVNSLTQGLDATTFGFVSNLNQAYSDRSGHIFSIDSDDQLQEASANIDLPIIKIDPLDSLRLAAIDFGRVLAIDQNGNALWSRIVGGVVQQYEIELKDMDVAPDSTIVVAGGAYDYLYVDTWPYVARLDSDGNVLWTTYLNLGFQAVATFVSVRADNSIVIAGYTVEATPEAYPTGGFVALLDPDGGGALVDPNAGGALP